MTEEDRYMKTADAAKYLGYSEVTMRNARVQGKLANRMAPNYYGKGKSIRYLKSELDSWMQEMKP
jgi:predicted DNA-binding transcriptional regulator AlpA